MTPLQHLIAVAQSQDMVWRADQAAPTASLLMPAMSAIVDLLGQLRRECDGVVAGLTPPATGYPIGFCSVICNVTFSVFIRVKGSWIHIDIRIKFLNCGAISSCLQ